MVFEKTPIDYIEVIEFRVLLYLFFSFLINFVNFTEKMMSVKCK